MSTTIQIRSILHEGAITGRHSGRVIREAVAQAMPIAGEVVLDFAGINLITQSSADEFVGRIVREHQQWLPGLRFVNCAPDVQGMLQWAANHAFVVYEDHSQTIPA
jgi:hypothetical protein